MPATGPTREGGREDQPQPTPTMSLPSLPKTGAGGSAGGLSGTAILAAAAVAGWLVMRVRKPRASAPRR